MAYRYDLRALFLTDAFSHSGVYDASPGDVVLYDHGVRRLKTSGRVLPVQLPQVMLDEPDFQRELARLLMLSEPGPLPSKATPAGHVLRRLGKGPCVVSVKTMEDTIGVLNNQFAARISIARVPPRLETWYRLFERDVYLNSQIPDGIVLSVLAEPENVGIINTPHFMPRPMRVVARAGAARAFLLKRPSLASLLRRKPGKATAGRRDR